MFRISPLPESEATDKVAQTYSRIKEMLGSDAVPEQFLAFGRVPAFLHDYYMNFKRFVWTDGANNVQIKATLALVVSATARCPSWTEFFVSRCRQLELGEQYVADAIAVAATCQMYNIFFKFRDNSGSDLFGGMSVGLLARTFANTSLDEKTTELINIVISDINGCKACTAAHVTKARQLGLSDDAILEAVQCAATVAAGSAFLNSAGN